ncbi:MAG: LLM class flavin-dependent oxidoreductase [Firmicutes bacterium]|jgi:hypothetical protein|nr:LLM class flavin-dependent oxidoreductase [Bacillota bacterium]
MKIGVILPTFTEEMDLAVETAIWAEDTGLDGVFSYDHIWPIGYPDRPAISAIAVLGMLTQQTKKIALGTLVARVGLLPDNLLISQMKTLNELSYNRVIAGIGTGDKKSILENRVLGIPEVSVPDRQKSLKKIASILLASAMPTWIGAGLASTNNIATEVGAKLNFWNTPPDVLREKIFAYVEFGSWDPTIPRGPNTSKDNPVFSPDVFSQAKNFTWAGVLPREDTERQLLYRELSRLGISWAVFHLGSNEKSELREAITFLSALKSSN